MEAFAKPTVDTTGWRHGRTQFGGASRNGDGRDAPLSLERDFNGDDLKGIPGPERAALLRRVVSAEILPRLAAAKRAVSHQGEIPPHPVTTEIDMLELVRRLLAEEADTVPDFVQELLGRGNAAGDIYIGIFADAARYLGTMWHEDRCDFVQVTIGLGRLQQAARVLAPIFQRNATGGVNGYSVLLMPAPREQHTFGLVIVGEFFQRAGWRVGGGPVSTRIDAADLVRNDWYDVVGFSIASDIHVALLTKSILGVRRASRNRHIAVMIGGPAFLRRPELLTDVGADGGAVDANDAVRQAALLVVARIAAE
jgi:MerR family transcriptional regulator, light-induced transcriptional regulator